MKERRVGGEVEGEEHIECTRQGLVGLRSGGVELGKNARCARSARSGWVQRGACVRHELRYVKRTRAGGGEGKDISAVKVK